MKILVCLLGLLFAGASIADGSTRFRANLEGFNLRGEPVATAATGEAKVEVIDNGSALAFRVNVANFDNLLMAHIHIADSPVMVTDPSGPPVYWFNGGPPPQGTIAETINGRLAQGFIFTPGQLNSSRPDITSVEDLIAAIQAGRASVIVHSSDFPAGELRGTLK